MPLPDLAGSRGPRGERVPIEDEAVAREHFPRLAGLRYPR